MLLSSFPFILGFLPVVILLHRLARRLISARVAQMVLLLASLGFYAWAKPAHLLLLFASILFNFEVGKIIRGAAEGTRRFWLILGLSGNLIFLGMLKYSGFAVSILNTAGGLHFAIPHLWFPLGVSFFTLQQIMYLMDCYEGLAIPHGLLDHASFVACFPYVSMGPLVRSRRMMPQLLAGKVASAEDFGRGLNLFAIGLFKKAVIADGLGRIVDAVFSNIGSATALEAWISCSAYCLQIYFDFSGYCDMAIGAGRMFGLTIPVNFNAPYQSLSIIEFWQRWHITLSQFITTYLYTPIIRSMGKATLVTASLATVLAMTLAGLWHGPAWTFVGFGAIHGIALVINQIWRKQVKKRVPAFLGWTLTMGVVFLGFLLFRSASLSDAMTIAKALFINHTWIGFPSLRSSIRMAELPSLAIPMLLAAPLAFFGPDSNEIARRFAPTFSNALSLTFLLLVSFLFLNSVVGQDFVYFAF